jgi:hypothetical protein
MPKKPTYKSLAEAMLAVLREQEGEMKAGDLVAEALRRHPLGGKTPAATASTTLLTLRRKGLVEKPDPKQPMYRIAPTDAPAEEKPKRRSRRS